MAKKLAEEAVEVAIDAIQGQPEAVVRESADLLYNLVVLWVSSGVKPADVWDEMERRERLLGIAEKLPKDPPKDEPTPSASRKIVACQCAAGESGDDRCSRSVRSELAVAASAFAWRKNSGIASATSRRSATRRFPL
jgi:hypothetical protein